MQEQQQGEPANEENRAENREDANKSTPTGWCSVALDTNFRHCNDVSIAQYDPAEIRSRSNESNDAVALTG